ncbi:MAG TPA: ferredoxin [Burkholderiaceae bacterium]|nr:ferredoxin [Burkholderiaceae bacterium]
MTQPLIRVKVDRELCQGHNRCKKLAPELFDLDEYGLAREAGTGIVPPELLAKARLAEDNCPEFAVRVEEAPAGD